MQLPYLHALIALHEHSPQEAEDRILKLYRSGNTWTRRQVLREANNLDAITLETRKQLVLQAVQNDDDVGYELGRLLANLYKPAQAFVLDTLKATAVEGTLTDLLDADGREALLRGIAETDRSTFTDALEQWLQENPHTPIRVTAPRILQDLYTNKPAQLLSKLKTWASDQQPLPEIRANILHHYLSKAERNPDKWPTTELTRYATQLAEEVGIDTATIDKEEPNPIRRALRYADRLGSPTADVDYEQLFQNLDLISHIRDFMGAQWWEKQRDQKTKGHLLLHLFDHDPPDTDKIQDLLDDLQSGSTDHRIGKLMQLKTLLQMHRVFLYWDDIFSRLNPQNPGIGSLRREMKNPTQTVDALAEAELISLLSRTHQVDAKPQVAGLPGPRDLQVHLTDQSPVIEAYNPKPEWRMRHGTGVMKLNPNHLKGKVADKLGGQLEGAQPEHPLILAINATGTTHDEWDVQNILKGTSVYKMWFNKDTGEAEAMQPARRADDLSAYAQNASIISGILLYRRDLTSDSYGAVHPQYHHNPHAKIRLTDHSVKELCTALNPNWTAT